MPKNIEMSRYATDSANMDSKLEQSAPGIYRYRPERLTAVRDDFAHRARLQVDFARALSRVIDDPDLSDESKQTITAVLSFCIEEIDQSFSRYGQPFPLLNPAKLARAMDRVERRGSSTK